MFDANACKEAGPVGGASLYSDLTTSPWQPQTGTIVCSQGVSHTSPFMGEYQKCVFFYPDIVLGEMGEFQGNETVTVPNRKNAKELQKWREAKSDYSMSLSRGSGP